MNRQQKAERLVQTYADDILRLSYTYLKNTTDAQDICQEVLMKRLACEKAFDSSEHEKAWILRVTINHCKDFLKSAWQQRTCSLENCLQMAAPEMPTGEITAAVEQLPAKYRTVIYLFYFENYSAQEIGEIMGAPTATVHTWLARGRQKLKKILGGTAYERA